MLKKKKTLPPIFPRSALTLRKKLLPSTPPSSILCPLPEDGEISIPFPASPSSPSPSLKKCLIFDSSSDLQSSISSEALINSSSISPTTSSLEPSDRIPVIARSPVTSAAAAAQDPSSQPSSSSSSWLTDPAAVADGPFGFVDILLTESPESNPSPKNSTSRPVVPLFAITVRPRIVSSQPISPRPSSSSIRPDLDTHRDHRLRKCPRWAATVGTTPPLRLSPSPSTCWRRRWRQPRTYSRILGRCSPTRSRGLTPPTSSAPASTMAAAPNPPGTISSSFASTTPSSAPAPLPSPSTSTPPAPASSPPSTPSLAPPAPSSPLRPSTVNRFIAVQVRRPQSLRPRASSTSASPSSMPTSAPTPSSPSSPTSALPPPSSATIRPRTRTNKPPFVV